MRVFITGATSGIGRAVALNYLQNGHEVAVLGRSEEKFQQSFKNHTSAKFYQVDICDRKRVLAAIEDYSSFGEIDIVIANAGISMGSKTKIPNFDKAREVIETNLFGVLNTFEGAFKQFEKQKRGHLVAVSSVAGQIGLPGTAAYSASKAAVIKLCETFAIDLESLNINVTNILPGFIDTPLTQVNPHPMPFLMPSELAAEKIVKAIEKKKKHYAFPWQLAITVKVLEIIPRGLYRFLMKLKAFNYSRS